MAKKTRKKEESPEDLFIPGTEGREIFCLVLNIISRLRDEKKAGIEVDTEGNLELDFSLTPSEIEDYVSGEIKDKLTFKNFMQTVSTEIDSLVAASIYPDKAKGIENNIPPTVLKEVGTEEFLWRLKEIEKVITISKAIKQDAIFRKTTKGLILRGIKWETNSKTFDEELGHLDCCKYATLSILYSQPSTEPGIARLFGAGFGIQLPTVTEPKQITLGLQKKDVTKLIDSLQQILDTL